MEIEQQVPPIEHQDPPSDPPASPSLTPPIPPTPLPPAPSIDPAYVKLLEGSLAEQNRRLAELERRNTEPAPPSVPVKTKDELRQEYFDSPIDATRKLIREELEATVGPLKDFVAGMRGQTAIDKLIDRLKINPRFQRSWNVELEAYVREQAAAIPVANLSENSLNFVVLAGIGLQQTGDIVAPAARPSDSPPPLRDPVVPTPPHMRPSAPASPSAAPRAPKTRELNENERRLLREYNNNKPADKKMTEAQFVEWQTMPSNEVAHTKFDRPAAPAGGIK
jgi:hypothetical protein